MSFAYALTFLCDALLYYGAVGCLGLLSACRTDLFLAPLFLLAGCWLSGRLIGRGRPWLRWLPMAAAVPAVIAAGNWPGRLVTLPMLAYLPLYLYNNRRAPDYDYAADRFRHSLIGMAAALVLAALFRAPSWKRGLPYLFLYFTLNITLLRLLRHDDSVARSKRFQVLNLLGVALVCAAGFALSQPAVIAALQIAWSWFLENVVFRLLALAAYALQCALYGVGWVLLKLFGSQGLDDAELPSLASMGDSLARGPMPDVEVRMLPAWVQWAIKGAGIALLAALVLAILRLLSRRIGRASTFSGTEVRESLDANAPASPRRGHRRGDPGEGVRRWYRQALLLIRARGGKVSPTMNTLQIQQRNAHVADEEAMEALREAYLPVRYGGREPSREDAARAKAAYERLKRAKKQAASEGKQA